MVPVGVAQARLRWAGSCATGRASMGGVRRIARSYETEDPGLAPARTGASCGKARCGRREERWRGPSRNVPAHDEALAHGGEVPGHAGQVPEHSGEVPARTGGVTEHGGEVPART